jgi:hypothetical protein
MKTPSMHQLNKRLARERNHSKWLEKNLRSSKQERESKKAVLKLQTEIAFRALK